MLCLLTKSCRRSPARSILMGLGIALIAAGLIASNPSTPAASDDPAPNPPATETTPVPNTILDLKANLIDGTEKNLKDYKGKVLLIVNVASRCGFTRQYTGLEALHREYAEQGFAVLGFPANDFGNQEPGSNKEILEFCQSRFDVSFPMFEKVQATGEDAHPLFKRLAAQPEPIGGPPKWNFTKFLIDREGTIVARYDSRVEPNDERLLKKLGELLEAPRPAAE